MAKHAKFTTRVNDEITAASCILIDDEGTSHGECTIQDALAMAEDRGYDLVEMNQNDIPVCKLMDYGKYKFEQGKKAKAAQKASKRSNKETKQMKFRMNIGESDIAHKCKLIRKFLSKGHKVQVIVMLRGREMSYVDIANQLIDKVCDDVADISKRSDQNMVNGHDIIATLSPR